MNSFGDNSSRRGKSRFSRRSQPVFNHAEKTSPLTDFKRNPDQRVDEKSRRFFEGACASCCPNSRGTLTHEIIKDRAMERCLEDYPQVQTTKTEANLSENIDQVFEKVLLSESLQEEKIESDIRKGIEALNLTFKSQPPNSMKKQTLFPSGILFHQGELEVLERARKSGYRMIFIPRFQNKLDPFILRLFLNRVSDISPLRVIVSSNSTLESIPEMLTSRTLTLCQDYHDEYGLLVERETILALLKDFGENFIFHIQCYQECGISDMTCGLLQYFLEFVKQEIEDILVVPVSMSYEFEPKLKNMKFEWKNYFWTSQPNQEAMTVIRMDQPFSVKEFADNNQDLAQNDMSYLTNNLSEHVLFAAGQNHRILPSHIVSFIILFQWNSGMTKSKLLDSFERIRSDITSRKREVGFLGNSEDVMNRTVHLMKDFIWFDVDNDQFKINNDLSQALVNLAENVTSIYALESIILTSILAKMNLSQSLIHLRGTHCQVESLSRDDVMKSSRVLYHLLQERFYLIRPCGDFEALIGEAIDNLITQDILFNPDIVENARKTGGLHLQDRTAQKWARHVDREFVDCDREDNEPVAISKVKVSLKNEAIEQVSFLISLISSHIYAIYKVVGGFELLLGNPNYQIQSEKQFLMEILDPNQRNKDWIRYLPSCLQRFENLGIIQPRDEKEIALSEDFQDATPIQEFRSQVYRYVM